MMVAGVGDMAVRSNALAGPFALVVVGASFVGVREGSHARGASS